MPSKAKQPATPEAPPQDLSRLNRSAFIWRAIAAILSGVLLSCAFPPLGWNLLAWVALVPILLIPTPRRTWEKLAVGYIFGYVHFALNLYWLNEVGFGAGWLLALWCALFPMLWYFIASSLNYCLKDEKTASFPGAGPLFIKAEWQLILQILLLSAVWVATEYLRAKLFTGFPWNQLGISQYKRLSVVALSQFTGVYGVSFIIVLVNMVIAAEASRQLRFFINPQPRPFPWHLALITLVLAPVCIFNTRTPILPPEGTPNLRVAAIQGNIPQCRVWTEEQFQEALTTYKELSLKAVQEHPDLDLIVWPESAIPADMDYPPYHSTLSKLLIQLQKPLLVGTLKQMQNSAQAGDISLFNSAYLLDSNMEVLDYIDKMHRVPFGEYTPFGDQLPWLREMIGMGRDLTPGKSPHLIELPKGLKAGVNICFEDAFPEISRAFTLLGANLLCTITNDAWYNKSCGAEQHTSHVIFRAVENRRPFLRSGNNSHTCFITPDGIVMGQLTAQDGSPFTRDFQVYDLPIYDDWGTTFYTRHGDLFATLCNALSLALIGYLFTTHFLRKNQQLNAIRGTTEGAKPHSKRTKK